MRTTSDETKLARRTISRAPRSTPQRTLLYHSPPSSASSGSSTNSARGLSSKVNVKYADADEAAGFVPEGGRDDGAAVAGAECVTVGVMFRNALNPT